MQLQVGQWAKNRDGSVEESFANSNGKTCDPGFGIDLMIIGKCVPTFHSRKISHLTKVESYVALAYESKGAKGQGSILVLDRCMLTRQGQNVTSGINFHPIFIQLPLRYLITTFLKSGMPNPSLRCQVIRVYKGTPCSRYKISPEDAMH